MKRINVQKFASGFYPMNPMLGQTIQSEGEAVDLAFPAHITVPAAAAVVASTTGIHAAVTANAVSTTEVRTGFTQPAYPRGVTATAAGTDADVKATSVIVYGKDMAGNDITETLPAFTVNTLGTVTGVKAFAEVTGYDIPAQDGNGVTVALGFSEVLGIPYKLSRNTVLMAFHDNTKEGTAPTVTVSATSLANNTFDLNTQLNTKQVDLYLLV